MPDQSCTVDRTGLLGTTRSMTAAKTSAILLVESDEVFIPCFYLFLFLTNRSWHVADSKFSKRDVIKTVVITGSRDATLDVSAPQL